MTRWTRAPRSAPVRPARAVAAAALTAGAMLSGCAAKTLGASPAHAAVESIYVLRSIRESHAPTADGCVASRTGFAPYPSDAERFFSFWSVRTHAGDGRVVDAGQSRVAALRGCFGPTEHPARQHFFAEIDLGGLAFEGHGECLALGVDVPEPGLFPVRCQLVLSGLPAPFVGGLLTTNTITSKVPFGGDSDPPGYTQASIATIRLWTARPGRTP